MITAEEWARLRAEGDAEVAEWQRAEGATAAPSGGGAADIDIYAPFYVGKNLFGIDVDTEIAYTRRPGLLESYQQQYLNEMATRDLALLRAILTQCINDPHGQFSDNEPIQRAWAEACAHGSEGAGR